MNGIGAFLRIGFGRGLAQGLGVRIVEPAALVERRIEYLAERGRRSRHELLSFAQPTGLR
jgi:hypothetical protein